MTIEIGDKVLISPNSEYYKGDKNSKNPKDVEGEVYRNHDTCLGYGVRWDNGETNSYSKEDLILVTSKEGDIDMSKKYYRVVKDHPAFIEGAILFEKATCYEPINDLFKKYESDDVAAESKEIVENSDWFERIYPLGAEGETIINFGTRDQAQKAALAAYKETK